MHSEPTNSNKRHSSALLLEVVVGGEKLTLVETSCLERLFNHSLNRRRYWLVDDGQATVHYQFNEAIAE